MIASSPTDLQPVMEAVAENAARVCGATDSSIFRLEGEHLRLVARHGSLRRSLAIGDTDPGQSRHRGRTGRGRPADDPRRGHHGGRGGVPGHRVPHRGRPGPPPGQCWRRRCCARARRWASSSSVGDPRSIPSRPSRSRSSRPSPTRRSSPSRTCGCSQELEARNRELTESLEQQTATSEILRVISQSPTDVQPVFDVIAQRGCEPQRCRGRRRLAV